MCRLCSGRPVTPAAGLGFPLGFGDEPPAGRVIGRRQLSGHRSGSGAHRWFARVSRRECADAPAGFDELVFGLPGRWRDRGMGGGTYRGELSNSLHGVFGRLRSNPPGRWTISQRRPGQESVGGSGSRTTDIWTVGRGGSGRPRGNGSGNRGASGFVRCTPKSRINGWEIPFWRSMSRSGHRIGPGGPWPTRVLRAWPVTSMRLPQTPLAASAHQPTPADRSGTIPSAGDPIACDRSTRYTGPDRSGMAGLKADPPGSGLPPTHLGLGRRPQEP